MLWRLSSFPECRHHVFLSHSREDHDELVRPVYDRLVAAGVVPWLDVTDYSYGRDSRTALRDALAGCRHVVFFVTDAMLRSGRGWCVLELGYAEILQVNFHEVGGLLANLILPLFFVPQGSKRLPRTVWQVARDRGRFCPLTAGVDPADWAAREVVRFLRQEERLADEWAKVAQLDSPLRERISATPGLFDRVTKFAPARLPRA